MSNEFLSRLGYTEQQWAEVKNRTPEAGLELSGPVCTYPLLSADPETLIVGEGAPDTAPPRLSNRTKISTTVEPRGTWKAFWTAHILNISPNNRLPRGFKEPTSRPLKILKGKGREALIPAARTNVVDWDKLGFDNDDDVITEFIGDPFDKPQLP